MDHHEYARKGSQRWLQVAVNRDPESLNRTIRSAMGLPGSVEIQWMSPLESHSFAEYRDTAALKRCEITLERRPLADFWPSRGPVWDGLARTSRGEVLLVEAKAHIPELVSPRSRATEPARGRIEKSMREVQETIAPKTVGVVDWTHTFYQYANRIAYLYLLREENQVPAHLVNIYFLNATDVGGPSDPVEWRGALKVVECYLGIGRTRISKYIHKVFVDATPLIAVADQPYEV
jgi:hypothetical protein